MFIYCPIHLDTSICLECFNRVFILYHKMFSYFRGSHGGLSDLRGFHMTPMVIHPHIFGHPWYVQRYLIGYLFCYILKCFPTLETVMGGCQTYGVSICPYGDTPSYIWTPPYVQRVLIGYFIYLYHKMFSYLRGSHGGLFALGCVHMPPMFICPLYVWTCPICLYAHLMFGCPIHWGTSEHMEMSKHMGASKHTESIWT